MSPHTLLGIIEYLSEGGIQSSERYVDYCPNKGHSYYTYIILYLFNVCVTVSSTPGSLLLPGQNRQRQPINGQHQHM